MSKYRGALFPGMCRGMRADQRQVIQPMQSQPGNQRLACGFLLGLPLMAMVIGLLTRDLKASTIRGHAVRGMLRIALACVAGLAVLYLIGLPYMYFVLAGKWSIQKTIVSGCLIFLPFDALKIVVTTLLCVRLLPVLRRD